MTVLHYVLADHRLVTWTPHKVVLLPCEDTQHDTVGAGGFCFYSESCPLLFLSRRCLITWDPCVCTQTEERSLPSAQRAIQLLCGCFSLWILPLVSRLWANLIECE